MADNVTVDRRTVLLAGGALALMPTVVPAAACGGTMPFGSCAWSLDLVPRLKAAGFDFWETGVQNALDPEKDDAWWQKRKAELAALKLPLRSCNGFLPGKFRLTGPKADPEPALRYAEIALRRAEDFGVKTVVFGSGGARNVPGDFTTGTKPDLEKGAVQYADFCRELCRRCADLKTVQIVIEPLRPNESNIVNYVWQGVQICEDVASPRLAQLADLFHMMMGRESPESLVKAGKLLRHCHVADYGTRMYPGHDPKVTVCLKPYFEALKSIGYTGGVSCECSWGKDVDAEYRIALKTLKELAS